MLDRLVIDFAKSFSGAEVQLVEPKMERSKRDDPNSALVPAHDKDGVPKYTVYLSMETKFFEKPKFDNITVTVASRDKLDEVIPRKSDVTLEGFEVGFMPKGNNGGYSMFYSAKAIHLRQVTQFVQPAQPQRMASPQPVATRPAGQ